MPEPDLFSPEASKTWYETYRCLRDHAPVYRVPGTDLYVLTRYEDIARVVRDSDLFSNEANKHGGEPLFLYPEARCIYAERGWPKAFPLAQDPPEHRRFRALVNHFFTGQRLAATLPMVERHVARLIEALPVGQDFDFVDLFASRLPCAVIGELLGLPEGDTAQLVAWSAAWALPFARGLSREQEIDVAEQGVAFQAYLHRHILARREQPTGDIISELAHARLDNRPLDDGEIVQIIDHLYIGGNETTAFALASGLWMMLRDPSIHAALVEDPTRIKGFVEEVLRLESPTQGLYRVATRDTDIAGTFIPRGATLHLRFAAANRDPGEFADPDTIRFDRPNAMRHMAFSQAEHHCPGAGLSRMELCVAFEAIIRRIDGLALSADNDFAHVPGFVLRALQRLHVRCEAISPPHGQ